MIITQIKSMQWMDANKQLVSLIADTSDEGLNLEIGTTYGPESIIWEAIRVFPIDQIKAYVAPLIEEYEDILLEEHN
jgi:hypothetical protein